MRNAAGLLLVRALSMLANLVTLRLGLDLLEADAYGVWLVLSSVAVWISFLDFGIGNGVRNMVAESISHLDPARTQSVVSTGYLIVGGVSVFLSALTLLVSPLVDWVGVLNAGGVHANGLQELATMTLIVFSLRLTASLILPILLGVSKAGLSGTIDATTSIVTLLGVALLNIWSVHSLFVLGILTSCISVLIPSIFSLAFYLGPHRSIRPRFSSLDAGLVRPLLRTGTKFFVINLAGLMVFASSNLVIVHLFGPHEVTQYNIAVRYFGVLSIGFSIFLTPFWSSFTDAYIKRDFEWIRQSIQRLRVYWVLLAALALMMLLMASHVYSIWLGDSMQIPFVLSGAVALYTIVATWNNVYAYFLNGVGIVHLQMLHAVLLVLIQIPLSLLFAGVLGLGPAGVAVASCLGLFVGSVVQPIQYRKIIVGEAYGYWGRA